MRDRILDWLHPTLIVGVVGLLIVGLPVAAIWAWDQERQECVADAESLGWEFWDYQSGGFGDPECWALNADGEPTEIW